MFVEQKRLCLCLWERLRLRRDAMTNFQTYLSNLPHEKLVAYQEARKLLACVHEARITDARLKDQALRAAVSIGLNIAEGAGRTSVADKARVYSIARGETSEVAAALDLALLTEACLEAPARQAAVHAQAVYSLLSGLIRRAR